MAFSGTGLPAALLFVCFALLAPAQDASPLLELPRPERNPLDLVRVRPEITPGQQGGDIEGFGPYGFRGNSSLNSYGQRGQSNTFLLDGVDNNDPWVRNPLFLPRLETVREVKTFSGYIPAEFGRAAGMVVDVETRSGSNAPHGAVYGFRQSSFAAARNFFDGAEKPGLSRTEAGAQLGGPIRRERWFFFGETGLKRDSSGQSVISTVPGTLQKAGQFDTPIYDPASIYQIAPERYLRLPFAGNRIDAARVSPAARRLMGLYPDPNLPGAFNNYRYTGTRKRDSNHASIRSDYSFGRASSLFARLNYESARDRAPGAFPSAAGFSGSDSAQNATFVNTDGSWLGGALAYSKTMGSGRSYEARLGVTSSSLRARTPDAGHMASAFLIPGLSDAGLPFFNLTGYGSLGASTAAPFDIGARTYDLQNSLAGTVGRHALQAGAQVIRRHASGDASEWSRRGAYYFAPDYTSQPGIPYTGDAFAAFLLGYPNEIRRDVQGADYRLRGWEWAGFVQDSFRLGKRWTLNAGVRYSLLPPLTEAENRVVNFNFERSPALNQFAGQGGVSRYAGVRYKKQTFAPRLGFALDVFRNGAAVLRGSFSQAYDTGSYLTMGRLARNAPYASRLDAIYGTFQLGARLDDGLPAPAFAPIPMNSGGLGTAIYAIETEAYTPYADQWSLALDLRLNNALSLELDGMGSMGMHLYSAYDANQPYPAPTPYSWDRYPYEPSHARIDYLGFGGGSTYYGGTAKLTGRWERFQFVLGYTRSKALDDASAPSSDQASRPAVPQYVYHLRGARSPSSYDLPQRLVWTATYDLTHRTGRGSGILANAAAGWRVQTVVTAQSGLPFTPELAVNSLNNGGVQLPDRVAAGSLASAARSVQHWFNTSLNTADPAHAFEIPELYQYGNSGFNILRGPGLFSVDSALVREFRLGGDVRLRARAEAYNLLNRTNPALPFRILGTAAAGSISHTATPSRRLQAAVSLEW